MLELSLSERAQAFLATLRRLPSVSTEAAISRFGEAGVRLPELLIQFHHNFAGYVIPFGFDEVVLGLAHDQSRFLGDDGIAYDFEDEELFVACADSHPSYDFWLSSNGSFAGLGSGGPCSSFDEFIEKLALASESASTSNNS